MRQKRDAVLQITDTRHAKARRVPCDSLEVAQEEFDRLALSSIKTGRPYHVSLQAKGKSGRYRELSSVAAPLSVRRKQSVDADAALPCQDTSTASRLALASSRPNAARAAVDKGGHWAAPTNTKATVSYKRPRRLVMAS